MSTPEHQRHHYTAHAATTAPRWPRRDDALVSFLDAQVAARHSEALMAWLANPLRSGPLLDAIATPSSTAGEVPLGVAVARLSSHHEPCELPRVMWLPTQQDATVLVFGQGPAALAAVSSSIAAARACRSARDSKALLGPSIYASTHLEELTVPSLLARATAVLALSDSSPEEVFSLVGVSANAVHFADSREPLSAWWRQDGNVYAVELARWPALSQSS